MPPQHQSASVIADPKTILKELEQHNAFFDDLVDMIPAKLYVAGNSGDGLYNSKYKKGQFKESKESRRARNKIAKKNKFDPSHQESTLEEKIRFEKEQLEDDSDDESDNMDHIVDTHEEEAETRNDKMEISTQLPSTPSKDITAQDSNPTPPLSANQSRIEQLRSRLHAKLEEKRSQRPVTPGTNDTMVSKRAARRAEKKRRIELAIKKKEMSGSRGGAGSTQTGRSSQPKIVMKDLGGSKINDTTALNSIDNTKNDDLSGIDFGGIAGLKNDLVGNYSEANKSLKNKGKKKSLERLLAEAEAKKDRLRQLKESGDAEDKEKAKKIIWGDTLKIASGENMKQANTILLKKAIKRKVKKKAKSQEAWKSRMDQTQEKMDEKLRVRSHNMKQRSIGGAAGANLSKKRIKDDDKGTGEEGGAGSDKKKRPRLGPYGSNSRPGFEGKKVDFINKGKDDKGKSQ